MNDAEKVARDVGGAGAAVGAEVEKRVGGAEGRGSGEVTFGVAETEVQKREMRERVGAKVAEFRREYPQVSLMAVTKMRSMAEVEAVLLAGVDAVGENKVQEIVRKYGKEGLSPTLLRGATVAMIGHLQTNKAGAVAQVCGRVASVDSVRVAEALSAACVKKNVYMDMDIQIHISNEKQKYGVQENEVEVLAEAVRQLPNMRLTGVMVMGRAEASEEELREIFSRGKAWQERLGVARYSAGMSEDYRIAIACGATEVRLGSALFK